MKLNIKTIMLNKALSLFIININALEEKQV